MLISVKVKSSDALTRNVVINLIILKMASCTCTHRNITQRKCKFVYMLLFLEKGLEFHSYYPLCALYYCLECFLPERKTGK